jgi:hypothetical protein
MGDRGNVKIVGTGEPIYLYTHWGGYKLPDAVKRGLIQARGDGLPWDNACRFNDAPYLARCIFQAMVGGDTGNTGFGISTTIEDNEHPIIVLDADTETVSTEGHRWAEATGKSCKMADFAAAENPGSLIGFAGDDEDA